jgi:hypothetical protein
MAQDHGDTPFIEAMLWGWSVAMAGARDRKQTPAVRARMLTRAGIMRRQVQDLLARQDALLRQLQSLLVDQQSADR